MKGLSDLKNKTVKIFISHLGHSRLKKLILKCSLSPGDIVTLTAAVRDLHLSYPLQFQTDVRTSCMELWENNPYLTPLSEDDADVQILECSTPLINSSNRAPYHYIHAFSSFFGDTLGLHIRPGLFKGDIHLSPQEKAWYSQIHELTGEDTPFWIIAAGGKYDITIKWWDHARYQKIVDHFRGKIQFVQVGAPGHFHPKLRGTIDLRGKTNLREMVRLVYHSQGVLCGVTALMHLAAAVETKPGAARSRPCVVVAGGREPAHWEAYPDHQFICTNGSLPCCSGGGCWRARTRPLGDGDERDRPESLCVNVAGQLPRCMDMILAEDVIRRINIYFEGGVVKYLTTAQLKAARKGEKEAARNPFDEATLTLHNARIALEAFCKSIPSYPGGFAGQGIVICAGGIRYFTNAWVCVKMLRRLGCNLPIEIWFRGPDEMDDAMIELVKPYGVKCIDAFDVAKRYPVRRLGGWELKAYAILRSSFQDVLFLDADNLPVVNPEFLFDTKQYRETGAIFWPDIGRFEKTQAAWDSCGLDRPFTPEFESGQIVVDKERCWNPMRLALWFNENSDFYYQHIHGDKETFHLAFHKLEQPYGMVQTPVDRLVGTMCQHDFSGRRIFQHRNMDKWNLFLINRRVPGFLFEEDCREFVGELQSRWDGWTSRFLKKREFRANLLTREPSPSLHACMISCAERAPIREDTLRRLSLTDWEADKIFVQVDAHNLSTPNERQTETAFLALAKCLDIDATHFLFLEDDLEFNAHLRANLCAWNPIRNGTLTVGSIYNPRLRPRACSVKDHFSLCDPLSAFGSQALVISKQALGHIVQRWEEIEGMQDLKITRLAARIQNPIYFHTPSLVQHIGKTSTWGGGFHQAGDFLPFWKNPLA
jgi:hypothetical protein